MWNRGSDFQRAVGKRGKPVFGFPLFPLAVISSAFSVVAVGVWLSKPRLAMEAGAELSFGYLQPPSGLGVGLTH